jgi:hypothetical protein
MPYDLPFDPEPSPAIRRSHVWRPAVFWIVLIGRLWEYLDWRAMQ